jgi:hypothetical protein
VCESLWYERDIGMAFCGVRTFRVAARIAPKSSSISGECSQSSSESGRPARSTRESLYKQRTIKH